MVEIRRKDMKDMAKMRVVGNIKKEGTIIWWHNHGHKIHLSYTSNIQECLWPNHGQASFFLA